MNATQVPCGSTDLFCPEGTGFPKPVQEGYYTLGGLHEHTDPTQLLTCRNVYNTDLVFNLQGPLDVEFDSNRFCVSAEIGDNATRWYEQPCEPGHFCVNGLRYEVRVCVRLCVRAPCSLHPCACFLNTQCTPGRYGESEAMADPQCSGPCALPAASSC